MCGLPPQDDHAPGYCSRSPLFAGSVAAGFLVIHIGGAFIHIRIVIAVIVVILHFVRGRLGSDPAVQRRIWAVHGWSGEGLLVDEVACSATTRSCQARLRVEDSAFLCV
jgi:hypothetical protein